MILRDLRYGCRSLIRQPGWSIAAVICLAVGIGPNTAAFSVVNGVLLRPLPFPDSHQLVMVAIQEPDRAGTRPFAWSEYRDVVADIGPVAELAVRTFAPVALATDRESRMVEAELASANYFQLLRLTPVAGRFLRPDADRPGAPREAVISHGLWLRRFNADPAVVGRVVRVNSEPVAICGVAPPGFVGVTSIIAADLWLPASLAASLTGVDDTTPQFGAVARLGPSRSGDQLRAKLDLLVSARTPVGQRQPTTAVVKASGFGVPPAGRGAVVGASALLFGLLTLVTGVAVANVASLTLARATDRRREIGLRLALGAGTRHIVSQTMAESVLLALVGGAIGLLLAVWVTRGLAALAPDSGQPAHVMFAIDVTPDFRVFAYAVVAAIAVAGLFGLAPARSAARTDVIDALRGSSGSGRRPATVRTLMAIVIAQIAVSTTLLVGAGLLVRTYLNTLAVNPGIETRNIVAVSLDVDQLSLDASEGRRLYEELVRRVSALPGVERVGLSRERPLTYAGRDAQVWTGDSQAGSAEPRDAGAIVVTPEYFDMLGIRLVLGTAFSQANQDSRLTAVVNETMARRFWPDGSPLGRTFHVRGRDGIPIHVIGVVKDIKYRSLTEAPRAVFYRPFAQEYSARMSLLVRWRPGAVAVVNDIERVIRETNRDLAIVDVATLEEQVRTSIAPRRQSAILLLSVCGLGLLLSSVGLYGVIAFAVRRRAREFGIRIALGAAARDVLMMVLAQGLRLMLVGLALGLAISVLLMRLIARMLYGVGTFDTATMVVAAGVLGLVTLAAVYIPARWATRVDPMVALREE